jgi:hypothetical protein
VDHVDGDPKSILDRDEQPTLVALGPGARCANGDKTELHMSQRPKISCVCSSYLLQHHRAWMACLSVCVGHHFQSRRVDDETTTRKGKYVPPDEEVTFFREDDSEKACGRVGECEAPDVKAVKGADCTTRMDMPCHPCGGGGVRLHR